MTGFENIKGIPKKETVWVRYTDNNILKYVITSNLERTLYYLYKMENGQAIKTGHKNKSPNELIKYIK